VISPREVCAFRVQSPHPSASFVPRLCVLFLPALRGLFFSFAWSQFTPSRPLFNTHWFQAAHYPRPLLPDGGADGRAKVVLGEDRPRVSGVERCPGGGRTALVKKVVFRGIMQRPRSVTETWH